MMMMVAPLEGNDSDPLMPLIKVPIHPSANPGQRTSRGGLELLAHDSTK